MKNHDIVMKDDHEKKEVRQEKLKFKSKSNEKVKNLYYNENQPTDP